MKVSTRGRYGIRAVLELALRQNEMPVSLKDIASSQKISLQYLEHLITPLINGGIIKSSRGAKGGISLTRHPSEIKLIDIIRLLEGPVSPVECVQSPECCVRSGYCAVRDIWLDIKKAVDNVLESTTVQDLIEKHKSRQKLKDMDCHSSFDL